MRKHYRFFYAVLNCFVFAVLILACGATVSFSACSPGECEWNHDQGTAQCYDVDSGTTGYSTCEAISGGCRGTKCPTGFTREKPTCAAGEELVEDTSNVCIGFSYNASNAYPYRSRQGTCCSALSELDDTCNNSVKCYQCKSICPDTYKNKDVVPTKKSACATDERTDEYVPGTNEQCWTCKKEVDFFKCNAACDGTTDKIANKYADQTSCKTANPGSICGVENCLTTGGTNASCNTGKCTISNLCANGDQVVTAAQKPNFVVGKLVPGSTNKEITAVSFYFSGSTEKVCFSCKEMTKYWFCNPATKDAEQTGSTYEAGQSGLAECGQNVAQHYTGSSGKCYTSKEEAAKDEKCQKVNKCELTNVCENGDKAVTSAEKANYAVGKLVPGSMTKEITAVSFYFSGSTEKVCFSCKEITKYWFCNPATKAAEQTNTDYEAGQAGLTKCGQNVAQYHTGSSGKCYPTKDLAEKDDKCKADPIKLFYCNPTTKAIVTTSDYTKQSDCTAAVQQKFPTKSCHTDETVVKADPDCIATVKLFYCNPSTKSVVTTTTYTTSAACTTAIRRQFPTKSCFTSEPAAKADTDCTPCTCPTGARMVDNNNTAAAKAAATTTCTGIGQVFDTNSFVPATCEKGAVVTTKKYCYTCVNKCTCATLGLADNPATAVSNCNHPSCRASAVLKKCTNGQNLTCYEAKKILACEPQVSVSSRIYGYVVSDPKGSARLSNGYCRVFGSHAEVGTNPDATAGNAAKAEASFDIELVPTNMSRVITSPNATNVIAAVGSYRFDNLPWNSSNSYDIVLRIKNKQDTSASLADGQRGVWVCSCPISNTRDPFTCFYPSVKVPAPSNNCVGGTNTYPYGVYTSGNDDEKDAGKRETLVNKNNCDIPAPNFFVTVMDVSNSPWWQARGGTVYGENGLLSRIPTASNVANTENNAATQQATGYNTCTPPYCAPYLVAQTCNSVTSNPSSVEKTSSAYPLINTGDIELDQVTRRDGNGGAISNNRDKKTARDTGDTAAKSIFYGAREDYGYFRSLLPDSSGSSISNRLEASNIAAELSVCRTTVDNIVGKFCFTTGDLTIADDVNFKVNAGESYTVFVAGSLNIGDKIYYDLGIDYQNNKSLSIQVAEGGYLQFIVGGDVNVAAQVGQTNRNMEYNDSTGTLLIAAGNMDGTDFPWFSDTAESASEKCVSGGYKEVGIIQGVFIANGSINIEGNADNGMLQAVGSRICGANSRLPDKKFVGEGTFVGWSGVNLKRDFDDNCSYTKAWNDRHPTETFNYRPDFLKNAPYWMYRSIRLRMESV